MDVKVKTINTSYIIRVNNEVAATKPTLKEARQHIKDMVINDNIFTVFIVKQTVTESVIDTYHTKTTKVLVASQLDEGIE